jgi:hypothetical protein
LLRITTVLIYIGCVVVNGIIAEWGPHNAKEVSDRYKLYVTPPPFILFIWAVIYLLMTIMIFYVTCKNTWPARSYLPLNIVNIANAVWVGIWSIGTNDAIVACSFIILLIPIGLLSLWVSLYNPRAESWAYYASRNVIAFYLGWVLAASVINFGIVLTYILGVSQKEFTIIFWVLVPLMAIGATIMNSIIQGSNGFKSCVCLWVSVFWGLAGALISTLDNKQNL